MGLPERIDWNSSWCSATYMLGFSPLYFHWTFPARSATENSSSFLPSTQARPLVPKKWSVTLLQAPACWRQKE